MHICMYQGHLKMYPIFFLNNNLTTKMANYSLVLPKFIREKKGLVNTMFRLEQEGEHIHQVLNQLERVYKSIVIKANQSQSAITT